MWKEKAQNQIEVYVEGEKAEIGWVTLPISKENMKELTLKATGIEYGKDYKITDYHCEYFPISEYENLEVLNKVADMIERLHLEERVQLKGWCQRHESGMSDLVEIGNAALQIQDGAIDYLDNIKTEEELGDYLMEETGIGAFLREKMKKTLDLDGDYIDLETIGREYDINNEGGYFVTDVGSNSRFVGYIRNDSEINEFEYSKEELMELDLDAEMGDRIPLKILEQDEELDAMQLAMKRTAMRGTTYHAERSMVR